VEVTLLRQYIVMATRFEPSIRAASQFFAAFIGFNLSHIVGADPSIDIGKHKLFFLCLSVSLFLRFFFGSANHLWIET
jgi:hypothetical protein